MPSFYRDHSVGKSRDRRKKLCLIVKFDVNEHAHHVYGVQSEQVRALVQRGSDARDTQSHRQTSLRYRDQVFRRIKLAGGAHSIIATMPHG